MPPDESTLSSALATVTVWGVFQFPLVNVRLNAPAAFPLNVRPVAPEVMVSVTVTSAVGASSRTMSSPVLAPSLRLGDVSSMNTARATGRVRVRLERG